MSQNMEATTVVLQLEDGTLIPHTSTIGDKEVGNALLTETEHQLPPQITYWI